MISASARQGARVLVSAAACICLSAPPGFAQLGGAADGAPRPDDVIAFVGVHVVPMDSDRVLGDQTIVVRHGRIESVGARSTTAVPAGARQIDGRGQYVLPGLTDAHVHLIGDGTGAGSSRSDFGDAPLYLAYGVTTVFNLRGTAEQLEWRRRIAAGELVGPTIYTAGEFVNEPRVSTAEAIENDIANQARAGFDLIKFHEIFEPGVGNVTTTGLAQGAYLRMNAAARQHGVPLVGHAPVNLGLDTMLEARQSVAHVGMLSNIHFFPLASHPRWLLTTAAGVVVLSVAAVATVIGFVTRRSKRWLPVVTRGRRLSTTGALLAALAALVAATFLPGGPYFGSDALRVVFTMLSVGVAIVAVALVGATISAWRARGVGRWARAEALATAAAALALSSALLWFWVPVAWRSSNAGISRLAERLRDAGVSVMTTIVTYDAIGGPGRARLIRDPAVRFLRADVQARWRDIPAAVPPTSRYTEFITAVARSLGDAGVPLIAGTDAMGFPYVTPGSSLHRELELVASSGLTNYEAIRTATVAPARFLGLEAEFGTIVAGRRADLLLVDRNPLDDIGTLVRPAGVMARGRWFSRQDLTAMLAGLQEGVTP